MPIAAPPDWARSPLTAPPGWFSRNGNAGVFALHRLPLAGGVEWTLGARYNRTSIDMNDRTPAAAGGDDNSLEGSHTFKRLNLTTGLAWQVTPGITLFGSGGQSSRAPSPLELSCANPDAPCRLPNGFVDDPPLEQVVATHFEIGARARARDLSWRAALFSSTNHDDIIFQAVNMFESFFDNVGDTRRRGLELSVGWTPLSSLRLSADYTYLQAEFLDAFNVSSPHHPVRAEGQPAPRTQRVEPGDRIPLVPEHLYRLGLDWRASRRLTVGLDLRGNSDQVFRGDRSNTDPERIDGFAVLDARLEAAFTEGLSGFLKVSNLLDSDYETFGMYGEPGEVLQDEELGSDPRFIGPGAPRGMWAGVTLDL